MIRRDVIERDSPRGVSSQLVECREKPEWTEEATGLGGGPPGSPIFLLVEAVAYLVEQLPEEPLLRGLLETERTRFMSQQTVLGESVARSRALLEHTDIDWAALGYRGSDFDDLVEYLLRIIQSMVLVPLNPPRSAGESGRAETLDRTGGDDPAAVDAATLGHLAR